jgi:hypothetical protein
VADADGGIRSVQVESPCRPTLRRGQEVESAAIVEKLGKFIALYDLKATGTNAFPAEDCIGKGRREKGDAAGAGEYGEPKSERTPNGFGRIAVARHGEERRSLPNRRGPGAGQA